MRRGLTFIELMIALAITAMIGVAIGGMLTTVSTGERLRRDNRAFVIRTHALKSRLAAYFAPARAVLDCDGTHLVLWYTDARQSDSVHGSEIRWLIFNALDGTIDVHYVNFPDDWTEIAMALEDHEYPNGTNWSVVYEYYSTRDLIDTLSLVDGLDSVEVSTDQPAALDSRSVIFDLAFRTQGEALPQTVTATVLRHQPPLY